MNTGPHRSCINCLYLTQENPAVHFSICEEAPRAEAGPVIKHLANFRWPTITAAFLRRVSTVGLPLRSYDRTVGLGNLKNEPAAHSLHQIRWYGYARGASSRVLVPNLTTHIEQLDTWRNGLASPNTLDVALAPYVPQGE